MRQFICIKDLFMSQTEEIVFFKGRKYFEAKDSTVNRISLIDERDDSHGISGGWIEYFIEVNKISIKKIKLKFKKK